ncbi:ROK family protein [Nakamurella endophytica]|uniref:ROK family protein n=1 Tax=Nakamurella endophytica TaxID=1748367 RepID=UPI00166B6A18|nr:ROK family protein [Nakamurella endophytica]
MRTVDPLVVALDVGGTSIKGALVDRAGAVVAGGAWETGVPHGPDAVVRHILDAAAELAGRAPDGTAPRGAGICVPGVVDAAAGVARWAANIGWTDVPLQDLAAARLGLPVALGHDVRTAALGEGRFGAGTGDPGHPGDPGPVAAAGRTVFCVMIGTGIAGGLVRWIDGVAQVDDGDRAMAGEVGHLVVRPGGPPCGCGNRGCLEALASASRIASRYRELTGTAATARDVADRAAAGDPAAVAVWTDAVDALADALAAVTVLLDPGAVVVGGGLSLAGERLTGPLRPALVARLTFRSPPPVRLSELGDRAGVLGAAALAWQVVERGRE